MRNILVAEREVNRAEIKAQKEARQPLGKYLTRADQYVRTSQLAKADRRFKDVHSQVLQSVADRVDKGTKAWLAHLGAGAAGKKSPPGFVAHRDYKSFCYPQYGTSAYIRHGKLHLSKLGEFKLNDFRKLQGKPKSITIKFEDGKWWAIVLCEQRTQDVYRSAEAVSHLPDLGGDPGLESLLTLADGSVFDPPKALRDALKALRSAQQDMSRKFEMRKALYEEDCARRKAAGETNIPMLRETPYSRRLRLQIKAVAKLHTKVKYRREHYHKKIARRLEKTIRCLAMEEHGVQFMIRNRRLARAASDRAIAAFKATVRSTMGMRYIPVGTSRPGIGGNSQSCLCNAPVPKTLKDRTHACGHCGLVAPRDVASANIVMGVAFGKTILQVDPAKVLSLDELKVMKEAAAQKTNNQAASAAGLVDGDLTVKMRGETKARRRCKRRCSTRVGKAPPASEVSVKREPVLSLRSDTAGGEPTARAETSLGLSAAKPTLPREANTLHGQRTADHAGTNRSGL